MFNEFLPSAEIEDKHNENENGHSRVSVQLPCHLIGEVEQLNLRSINFPYWMISCRAKLRWLS